MMRKKERIGKRSDPSKEGKTWRESGQDRKEKWIGIGGWMAIGMAGLVIERTNHLPVLTESLEKRPMMEIKIGDNGDDMILTVIMTDERIAEGIRTGLM